MASEEKPAAQGTSATVVATAAVTLAIGITVAAFGGYLVPRSDTTERVNTNVTEPGVSETRPAVAEPSAPNVVLVPVVPDAPTAPAITGPAQPAGEVLAAYPSGDHDDDDDDHHRGRKHRERKHEDDDDDHDED